jgi:hypothetical protein
MDSLATLYAQHTGRVSQRWSSYLDVFERTFGPMREQQVRILEVGVQNGGSLELWAQYFRQAKVLVGSDIDQRCGDLTFDDPRIHVVVGDVTTDEAQGSVRAISDGFEVIIDDGSHRSADIIETFISMYPLLSEGGVYVIEDLHCSYFASFGGGLFAQRSAIGFLRRLIDIVNWSHWGLDRAAAVHLQPLTDRPLSAAFLASLPTIANLEFHDSMCIIRRDAGLQPRLGRRIVTGSEAAVDPASLTESGRYLVGETRVGSAADLDPLEHEVLLRELLEDRARRVHLEKELRQELREVWMRLDRVLASPSYRLMNGPRRIFRALFRRRA